MLEYLLLLLSPVCAAVRDREALVEDVAIDSIKVDASMAFTTLIAGQVDVQV